MKMILGNKRMMLSLSGIVLALVLMMGGTFAWLTSGEGDPTNGNFGFLDVDVMSVDPTSPFNSITPIILQPGYSFNAEAQIVNKGNLKAVFVIPAAKVTLRSDNKGKPLAEEDYYPAPTDLYSLGYDIEGGVGNTYYSADGVTAGLAPEYMNVAHFVLPAAANSTGKNINIMYFDAAGEYYVYDDEGEPIWENGKWKTQSVDQVALNVTANIDFKSHAIDMGAEWSGALLQGFVPKATQGEYDQAIIDTFGLKNAQGDAFTEETYVAALKWADEVGAGGKIELRAAKPAGWISPADYLKKHR
jgi:hypothetical protein